MEITRPSTLPQRGLHSMLGYHALVLAAGAGSRFGGRKMLAPFGGQPLIVASARIALLAPVTSVTVVVGCDAAAVEDALRPLVDPRLKVTTCDDWATGISASLRAGILVLPDNAKGVIVFLGDMPEVPVDLAGRLLTALKDGAPVAMTVFRGAPAHPVAISRKLFNAVCGLTGDRGARILFERADGVIRVESDDSGSVFDVDRASDLSPF